MSNTTTTTTADRTALVEPSTAPRALLGSLHRKHAAVAVALVVLASTLGVPAALSAALASTLQAVNLIWLERTVRGWLTPPPDGPGRAAMQGALARLLLLLASFAAVLTWVPVEPVAFVLGMSSAVPTALWHGLSGAAPVPDVPRSKSS